MDIISILLHYIWSEIIEIYNIIDCEHEDTCYGRHTAQAKLWLINERDWLWKRMQMKSNQNVSPK